MILSLTSRSNSTNSQLKCSCICKALQPLPAPSSAPSVKQRSCHSIGIPLITSRSFTGCQKSSRYCFFLFQILPLLLYFTFFIHKMVLGSAEFSERLAQTDIHYQVLCLKLHVKPILESEDGIWYVLHLHKLLRTVKLKISEQKYQNNSNCWGRIHVTEVATTQSAPQPQCPFIFCLNRFCFYLSDQNHPEYAPHREL